MNRELVLKRLWWKELQLLWPLVAVLIGLGGLLQVLATSVSGQWLPDSLDQIVTLTNVMPGLFAAGIGALLVGQEKELRTIQWLKSLPIAARDIVSTKLLTGILGLTVVWGFSLVFGWLSGDRYSTLDMNFWTEWTPFVVHSFFLLFLSYAMAWRMHSSYLGLVALVPLAFLPFVANSIHQELFIPKAWDRRESWDSILIIYQIIFAGGFYWWGWRNGLRYFEPLAPPAVGRFAGRSMVVDGVDLLQTRRSSPVLSMLWQFAGQNRYLLLGLSLLATLGGVLLALVTGEISDWTPGALETGGAACQFLAYSWLGVLVFQSDAIDRRAMFLADRGIAPWKVWLTRLLIPTSFAILHIGVLLVCVEVAGLRQTNVYVPVAVTTFIASLIFGQIMRSPIMTALFAPVFSSIVVVCGAFALVNLAAPWWLLTIPILGWLIATLVLTGPWMDGRRSWRIGLAYAMLLLIGLAIPVVPFAIEIFSHPRMSDSVQSQLMAIANLSDPNNSTWEQMPRSEQPENRPPIGQTSSSVSELRAAELNEIKRQLATYPHGVPQSEQRDGLIPDLLLVNMHLQKNPTANRIAEYQSIVDVLLLLIERLRSSGDLNQQNEADCFEIALLEEVQSETAAQWMGPELRQRVVDRLSNPAARDESRLRAIAISWRQTSQTEDIRLIPLMPWQAYPTNFRESLFVKTNMGLLYETLFLLVNASEIDRPQLKSELAARLKAARFPVMGIQLYLQTDEAGTRELLYAELGTNSIIFGTWYEGWERCAAELK